MIQEMLLNENKSPVLGFTDDGMPLRLAIDLREPHTEPKITR